MINVYDFELFILISIISPRTNRRLRNYDNHQYAAASRFVCIHFPCLGVTRRVNLPNGIYQIQTISAISGTPLSDPVRLSNGGNHGRRLRPHRKFLRLSHPPPPSLPPSSRPITRISNGLHSSLTRRHRHVLNNLSPRSYRKVPSASWYDGSIVLEEERGLPRG